MIKYLHFCKAMTLEVLRGSKRYYAWMGFLAVIILIGVVGYIHQLNEGLIVTNMTDQVSWGAYIANFTYIVGLAAASVMLVIPAYFYKIKELVHITFVGKLFAVASIIMCLLFVVVDMGRPDRFWHIMPFVGRMNFPYSILAWDVIVLSGYLLLNLHIPGYLLYKKYIGDPPTDNYYKPFVYIAVFWAISIHTVTAFLYAGLGGRPFWNSAIVAPRFIASAFAVGPCFLLIALQFIRKYTHLKVEHYIYTVLKRIIAVAMIINLFLLGSEVFKEFYTQSAHTAAAKYLFFGLHGHNMLVPYIWIAVVFNVIATIIFASRKLSRRMRLVNVACVLAIVGIWVEKGMGLLVPGFIPSPLGDIVEYTPSITEISVSAGIWALGFFLFTLFLKAAIPIETGELRLHKKNGNPVKGCRFLSLR